MFFVDAAHFVVGSFLGWLWCAVRFFVRAASGRQRYNVLGAWNATTQELIRVTNHTYVTAETVCELLRKIAALDSSVTTCSHFARIFCAFKGVASERVR